MGKENLESNYKQVLRVIAEEYKRLEKHDPNHELLKYIENVTDKGFTNIGSKYSEMILKFQDVHDKDSGLKLLTNYYLTLRKTVNKIEGIDRSSKKHSPLNNL